MITIIDYGMGRLCSVSKALEYVSNKKIVISREIKAIITTSS